MSPIILDPDTLNPVPPTIVQSPDGKLWAWATPNGIQLRANFQTSPGVWPAAVRKVRFEANGRPVRSGNDAWAIGGIADAFDIEAAPGSTVVYRAFPVTIDGNSAGAASSQLTITAADISSGFHCWLKSISDPSLMMQARMQGDPVLSQEGSDTLEKPIGASLYAGGIDVAAEPDAPFTFKLKGKAELELFRRIIGSGTVLWQSDGCAGLDDFYGVRESASWPYQVGSHELVWLMSVTFRKVPRPSPYGAPLVIPGHSYADTQAVAPTFNDREAAFPTFQDTLGLPPEVAGP